MTELEPLIESLTACVAWHRARVTFLAQFMVAVIRVRTVNLTDLATAFCGKAKQESSYRRIQRFFTDGLAQTRAETFWDGAVGRRR